MAVRNITTDHAHIYGDGTNSTIGVNLPNMEVKKIIRDKGIVSVFQSLNTGNISLDPHTDGKIASVARYHYTFMWNPFTTKVVDSNKPNPFEENFKKYGFITHKDVTTEYEKVVGNGSSTFGLQIGELDSDKNYIKVTRTIISGQLKRFGISLKYTDDSVTFDKVHKKNEAVIREYMAHIFEHANYIKENLLQFDLLNGSNQIFAGSATSLATLGTGIDAGTPDPVTGRNKVEDSYVINYDLLTTVTNICNKYGIRKHEKQLLSGSSNDTKNIASSWVILCPHGLLRDLRDINHKIEGDISREFVEPHNYAGGGENSKISPYEIGSVNQFRFIEVPHMLIYRGVGAQVNTNYVGSLSYTGSKGSGKFDVFPLLLVGRESFETLTLTGQNGFIFNHVPATQVDRVNTFGNLGLMTIKFWHGIIKIFPERILQINVLARV